MLERPAALWVKYEAVPLGGVVAMILPECPY